VTDDVRSALGLLAQAYYGTATHCPTVVGITGTNGKTTESYLLEHLCLARGRKAGVMGTVSYRWPGHEDDAPLTTPGCLCLHEHLRRMHDAGVDMAFMEVSSHALDQKRVAGINFSAALLTNVTQDHLDYHDDMEAYFEAKAGLFRPVALGGAPLDDKVCALNADDDYCRRLLAEKRDRVGFGLEKAPVPGSRHLAGRILGLSPAGIRLAMDFEGKRWELTSPLVGGFNAMNLLGAQALALGMGLAPEDMAPLADFAGVRGRLERIANTRGLNVFVDYAHTPDALTKAISALRAAGFERVVTVFGCGGNRDRGKRPLMGQAVAALSDVAVLTSDNPRDEDPEAIMADVLPGLANCPETRTEPDRRKALALAVGLIGPDDALLVAGKGHETYQLIKGVKHPFSDQDILRELMSCA
jgi:UDP-N-acetylmuramoyl-L-alanyl-D-glutamate--2,6-diaminopimelate ligase